MIIGSLLEGESYKKLALGLRLDDDDEGQENSINNCLFQVI